MSSGRIRLLDRLRQTPRMFTRVVQGSSIGLFLHSRLKCCSRDYPVVKNLSLSMHPPKINNRWKILNSAQKEPVDGVDFLWKKRLTSLNGLYNRKHYKPADQYRSIISISRHSFQQYYHCLSTNNLLRW